jgi:hypothetical protein
MLLTSHNTVLHRPPRQASRGCRADCRLTGCITGRQKRRRSLCWLVKIRHKPPRLRGRRADRRAQSCTVPHPSPRQAEAEIGETSETRSGRQDRGDKIGRQDRGDKIGRQDLGDKIGRQDRGDQIGEAGPRRAVGPGPGHIHIGNCEARGIFIYGTARYTALRVLGDQRLERLTRVCRTPLELVELPSS